ncbi:MarR family transcriptional regulator [Bacillus coahuilensis m2-6]|uniref:MarR family transcriptional regulator n=1 Tax=Bacillus coahuilensis p1.1.43 TaxID=1150625 RepID=A0A147K7F2_9BACI|nr:MarR family transcriptional regulator [Bacillus coahuilensis]KUP05909.1 MarR family transcriptional regulator [Bacillus coahuilensis p1.1.43]KUP07003.1 MarR family transcriptional regulator [Bacillus coahuilensis m2-6]
MESKDWKNEKLVNAVADIEKDLRYISSIIKQKGREILNEYKITPPQFVALQWLFEEGDMTIGELSNKMYLAYSTTTDLIDRMENNELVKRVKDTGDRRVVRIHLLQKGEKIIEEVIVQRQHYLQDKLNDYDQEQIIQLKEQITKLHEVMKTE